MTNIFKVVVDLVEDIDGIAAFGLSEASDAWQNVNAMLLFFVEILEIFYHPWAWADEAHFAANDINKLWEFV